MVVPLPVPAVGPSEGAVSDVHRPLVPVRPGHGDHQDLLSLDGVEGHILRGQNVGADLGGVLHRGPELGGVPRPVGHAGDVEGLVPVLLHPQEEETADGVGKGGVGLPQAVGEAPGGLLGLDAVVLPVAGDVV